MLSPKLAFQAFMIGIRGDVIRGVALEIDQDFLDAHHADPMPSKDMKKELRNAKPGDWILFCSNMSMASVATAEEFWKDFEIDPVPNKYFNHPDFSPEERALLVSVRHKE